MSNIPWYENLKLHREKNKDSQQELSNKLGISKKTLQRYEKGTSEPTLTVLLRLSSIYQTSIDNLVGNKMDCSLNITKMENIINQMQNNCSLLKSIIYDNEEINI